jgi:riboflavin biosynthesis pyrimidine reductase
VRAGVSAVAPLATCTNPGRGHWEPAPLTIARVVHGGVFANGAAHAFRAGLVDEVRLFVSPLTVGGGNPFLPDRLRLNLQLLDERRFDGGVVHLQYRVSP